MSSDDTGRGGCYGLYTIGWGLAIVLCSPYLAWRSLAHPREMAERFANWGLNATKFPFWIHASSMGEVRGLQPLVRDLARRGQSPLISVVTPTARAISAELETAGAAAVRFAPLDFAPLMHRVISRTAPLAVLITETEIWPSLILESRRRGIPVIFINARLTSQSVRRLRLLKPWLNRILKDVHVCAQSDSDRQRWLDLGCPTERITVTGNTKYERGGLPFDLAQRRHQRGQWERIVVFGSVRSGELPQVRDAVASLMATGRKTLFIIAPRHLELSDSLTETLATVLPPETIYRRTGCDDPLIPAGSDNSAALVVQTMGELRRYYAIADVGFVGGTFSSVEGHNLFEPADVETPVFYGPHVANVADLADSLERDGAGFRCASGRELGDRMGQLLASEDQLQLTRQAAAASAASLGGSVARTITALKRWGIGIVDAKRSDPL